MTNRSLFWRVWRDDPEIDRSVDVIAHECDHDFLLPTMYQAVRSYLENLLDTGQDRPSDLTWGNAFEVIPADHWMKHGVVLLDAEDTSSNEVDFDEDLIPDDLLDRQEALWDRQDAEEQDA